MRIYRGTDNLPPITNSVITIGSFDGIHKGHKHILEQLIRTAKANQGTSIVITFSPHPRTVLYPENSSLELLSTLDEKIELFSKTGIDILVIIEFTLEFSQISPVEYVESFLIKNFDPSTIIIGYDHKFGLNRQGNIGLLQKYAKKDRLEILEISAKQVNDIAVSSTKIRNALQHGHVLEANELLGRVYSIEGEVVHGQKIGTELGYPTANINIEDKNKLIPSDGIYAVRVYVLDKVYDGMLYIGKKPTLHTEDIASVIEINIFNFEGDLYGKRIKIDIIDYIREDELFENLSLLKTQIANDKLSAKAILATLPNDNSKIAVVILNYNGQEYLESYLPNMQDSYSGEFDIIVIDNASTDDSVAYLEEWHPEVRIIVLEKNHGFAEGYNKGLEKVNAAYIVLLNSDIRITKNWLDPIIELMELDDSIAACQPKIRSLEDPEYFEYAGAGGGMVDMLFYPFCQGRIFNTIEKDSGQYDGIFEVFWASGAAFVTRNKLFKTFGGFDPKFFAHQEEIDLCWRFKRAGFKIFTYNDVHVHHLGGGTLSYGSPRKTYLNFRNNLSSLMKNEPLLGLLWKFPMRKGLDFTASLKFILSGEYKNAFSIFKAYFFIFFNLLSLIRTRINTRRIIKNNKIGALNISGQIKLSILFQYYAKSNKTWSSIREQMKIK